jgi:predicted DNA-binding protein
MDETKKRLGAELAKEIDRQVAAYLETEEIRKLVADSIAEGVKFALAELPAAAGSHFLSRLVGATLGDMHQWQPSTDDRLDNLANAVGKTQRALIDKGVLQYGQVPVVPVTA